jgi:hypothetical protein
VTITIVWLVREDDLGASGQRTADRNALLLAAGQLGRPVRQPVAESQRAHDGVEPRLVGRAATEPLRQDDVLGRRQRRQQVERLEHEPDPVAAQHRQLAVGQRRDVGVTDQHGPRRRGVERGHAVHQGRLAGARRSHDRRECTAGEPERDAVERTDRGAALPILLDQVDAARGMARVGGDARGAAGDGRVGRGHVQLLCVRSHGTVTDVTGRVIRFGDDPGIHRAGDG